jgi:hypothetical protein
MNEEKKKRNEEERKKEKNMKRILKIKVLFEKSK